MVCGNYPIAIAVLCDAYVAKAKCPGHKLNSFTTVVSWSSGVYFCLFQI